MNDIAIIGGGASALMCACFIKNANVTIFEKNSKLGKKLLATGNGRCNLANINMNKHSYNYDVSPYISRFNVDEVLKFFKNIGLEIYVDDEGRVYPLSNSASSVLDVLCEYLQSKPNVNVECNSEVTAISKCGDMFELKMQSGEKRAFKKVVVASGNITNLNVYENFVEAKPFRPSLCSLKTSSSTGLDGVRVSCVDVKCTIEGEDFRENGEVLFKDNGLSGIVIFNLSAFMARKNSYKNDVFLDFLPKYSVETLFFELKERRNNLKNYKIKDFLTGFFHRAICEILLSKIKVNYEKNVSSLSDEKLYMLTKIIKNYAFKTVGTFENNQVCVGGVELKSLDQNLQAKHASGLYFIGEACNVDGVCGGYNLMWAWASGKIVGETV